MQKRIFLIHGWEGSPEQAWRPWLRDELEQRGFQVIVPAMPDTKTPTMDKWAPYLAKVVGTADENSYFVGHSLGCITILRFLETLKENEKVGGVILVAGFGHDLEYGGYKNELASFFDKPIDWEKIKKHSKKFVAINSDDDPYVPLKHNEIYKEKLGAESTIMSGMKHFSRDDGITKLTIVLDKLLEMTENN